MADKDNQVTGAHVETAPQSTLTSSREVSSPPAKMPRRAVAARGRLPQSSKTSAPSTSGGQTITRCNMVQIKKLRKILKTEHMDVIDSGGAGSILRMEVDETVPAPLVRKVVRLVDDNGIMTLPGVQPLNLYDLAPLVTGFPNEGDFVSPALGHLKDPTKLKGVLRSHRKNLRDMNFLVTELTKMASNCKLDDVADEFMAMYMLVVLGSVCTPNSMIRANPKYLSVLCTGENYRWCDHFVDHMVIGFKNYNNGLYQSVNAIVYLPITILADFAILDGDDKYPPIPGFPRFKYTKQERLNRLANADLGKLKFRAFEDSVYSGCCHPRRDRDVLAPRSSYGSSPQPVVVDVDDHYCQPAMAKELLKQLHATDAEFINNFSAFMRSLIKEKLDGDTKVKAIAVLEKIKVSGKQIATDDAGAISHVFRFISEHKHVFVDFSDKVKEYILATDMIDRRRTEVAQAKPTGKCSSCFRYPSNTGHITLSCEDLISLEPNQHFTDTIINMYTYHLQGPHILPELVSSDIHNQYVIMDALHYDTLPKKGGPYGRDGKNHLYADKRFLFWPVNGKTGHWSLAIICNKKNHPAILHLDSLDSHDSARIFNNLELYIRGVLNDNDEIQKIKLKVPQQAPDDCGPCMLYNIKKFIMDYSSDNDIKTHNGWYDPKSASALRDEMKNLIRENKMLQDSQGCTCSTAKKWENCFVKRS